MPKHDWKCKSCGHVNEQQERPVPGAIEICENCKDTTENVNIPIHIPTLVLLLIVLLLAALLIARNWIGG